MTSTSPGKREGGEGLSPNQKVILTGFVGHFTEESNSDAQRLAYYDQVQTFLRERFNAFGLPIDTPEAYFPVMAGISIASFWIERLVAEGLEPRYAAEIIQDGFARLAPPGSVTETP